MIRELGYMGKVPISRAERVGGLDYYRERKDQVERKKHGHLQNIIV